MKRSISLDWRRIFSFAAALLLPLWVLQAAVDLTGMEDIQKKVEAVADKATSCIVALVHAERQGMASGSGVLISADGLILTAAHVVGDAETVEVTFIDGKHVRGKTLGADYARDVALVRIAEPGNYPCLEMGDTKDLAVGTMVVALGHPGGFDLQRKPPVRFGRVFQMDHDGYIRTDCTLVGGDSGGPLLGLDGKVLGVHSTVGFDVSVNNDSPVEAVRTDWDRLLKGDHWGQNDRPGMPRMSPKELDGLNLEKFRQRVLQAAMKSKGQLQADPETIARWLMDCGMDSERVKSMEPMELADFMQKALGGGATVHPRLNLKEQPGAAPLSDEELAGTDLDKFRKHVLDEAMQTNGTLESSPETIAGWLRDSGMRDDRVKAMTPSDLTAFVQKAMGAAAKPGDPARTEDGRKAANADDLYGLNVEQFRKCLVDEALKNQGHLKANPHRLEQWLRESGMREDHIKNMRPDEFAALMKKVLGSGIDVGNGAVMTSMEEDDEEDVLVEQDKEFLASVKPMLDKVAPGVVSLHEGDRIVAMGAVVRSSGFILTKHSEIAKVKGVLHAHLADGRTFPAVEVQQFPEHDLALVKIPADGLRVVSLSEDVVMHPGIFLLTPGTGGDEPMAGLGVLSVMERSLRQSGGFLGVGLNEVDDVLEVTHVVLDSPAAKAGVRRRDQIVSLDNTVFHSVEEFTEYIRKLGAESKVHLIYRHGGEERAVDVKLGDRAKMAGRTQPHDPSSAFGTEVSEMRGGYPAIFQHDQPLRPQDCGGVVMNLHGDVVGVNIARAGRVDTYAIPSKVVAELLKSVDFQKLETKGAELLGKLPKA